MIPKSRLYITYRTRIDGATVPKKLPLRLLVLGDFYGGHPSPVREDLPADLWSASIKSSIDNRQIKHLTDGVKLSSFMGEMQIMAPIEDEQLEAVVLGDMAETEVQLKVTRQDDDGKAVLGMRAVGVVKGGGTHKNGGGSFEGRVFVEGEIEATKHQQNVYRLAVREYTSEDGKTVYEYVRSTAPTLVDGDGKVPEGEILLENPQAKDKDGNDLAVVKVRDGVFLDAADKRVEGVATFQADKYTDSQGQELSGIAFRGAGIIIRKDGQEEFTDKYKDSWKPTSPRLAARGIVNGETSGRVGGIKKEHTPQGDKISYGWQDLGENLEFAPSEESSWDVSPKPEGTFIEFDDEKQRAKGSLKAWSIPARLTIEFADTDCFRPDHVAHQIPEVHRLLVIKELLVEMRTHVANNYVFGDSMRKILQDEEQRAALYALTTWMKKNYQQLAIDPKKVSADLKQLEEAKSSEE